MIIIISVLADWRKILIFAADVVRVKVEFLEHFQEVRQNDFARVGLSQLVEHGGQHQHVVLKLRS